MTSVSKKSSVEQSELEKKAASDGKTNYMEMFAKLYNEWRHNMIFGMKFIGLFFLFEAFVDTILLILICNFSVID